MVRFGLDHNMDGKLQNFNEPSLIMKYNYKEDKLVEIIVDSLNKELQQTLEGSN